MKRRKQLWTFLWNLLLERNGPIFTDKNRNIDRFLEYNTYITLTWCKLSFPFVITVLIPS